MRAPCPRQRKQALEPAVLSEAGVVPLPPVGEFRGFDTGLLVRNVLASLDVSKAEDVVSIDLPSKTTLADMMVIASGRSNVHVGATPAPVTNSSKEAGRPGARVEGLP